MNRPTFQKAPTYHSALPAQLSATRRCQDSYSGPCVTVSKQTARYRVPWIRETTCPPVPPRLCAFFFPFDILLRPWHAGVIHFLSFLYTFLTFATVAKSEAMDFLQVRAINCLVHSSCKLRASANHSSLCLFRRSASPVISTGLSSPGRSLSSDSPSPSIYSKVFSLCASTRS